MALFHSPSGPGELPLRIDIAEAPRGAIRVATSVLPTLLAVADGVCSRRPVGFSARTRATLGARDLWGLAPVVARPGGFVPDCLLPLPAGDGWAGPADELDRLEGIAPARLLAELDEARAAGPWRDVERTPARWLEAYAGALRRLWSAASLHWRRAAAAIDREGERIGAAIARGCLASGLQLVHASGTVGRDAWRLPGGSAHDLRIGGGGLVLVPRVAPARAPLITAASGRVLTHLAYPLAAPRPAAALTHSSSLVALVGRQRAVILRELERPRTAGRIAELLHAVPSVASHHVGALEAAGLVARERRGRHVVVSRTRRGTAVLSLYE